MNAEKTLIDQTKFVIVGKEKDGNYRTVSMDDLPGLEAARDELERDMAAIAMQLSEAQGNALVNQAYSDPKWYSKLIGAKKFKGAAHQRIQRRIKELKVASKSVVEQSKERLFIQLCRKRLTNDLYKSIWDEVEAILGTHHEPGL